MGAGPLRGQVPLTALGPDDVLSAVAPILIDAAHQGLKKVVLDGKTFAPFGMLPHAVEPVKVAAYRPKAGAKRVPAKVDLRNFMTTVEDQSQTNSCCANAVCGAYEYMGKRNAMEKGDSVFVDDISRLFIYYVGRKRDQQLFREDTSLAPRDEGMSLGGALSALEMKGACLEKNWPFTISKVNDTPSNSCFKEAIRYKIAESRKVPVDLNSMRQCLAEGHPIVFGLKLTAQFFKPSAGGGIVTPDVDDPQSAEHGLHAMLIVGYNDRQEVFIVRNSWGTSWGDKGYGYVPYDYICNDDFNFLGQYAIIGLSQYDFSRNLDDGRDYNLADPEDVDQPDLEEIEDEPEDDQEDDFDPEDEFNPEKEARRVFDLYDINHDGGLAGHELFMCFMGNGVPMSMKQFQKISKDHRLDKGEKMDFDQFWEVYRSLQAHKGAKGSFWCWD